jgi:ACS family tartrate transporter-like MFS transporter
MATTITDLNVEARARRRITRRLMPFVFGVFIVCYLDRVNVSYAGFKMNPALGFDAEVFGFGAGIFFVGYILLEIPSTLMVERWSARRWMARIMVSWGLMAVLMGAIHTATQFYAVRFLLGVAEAGYFPGMIVYLSHWFRYEDRARAVALFMAAIPIANILGAPVSGRLLSVDWFGISGWRWLFILEGLPAIVLGIIALFYLTDWPREAHWLSEDEREWITNELEKEAEAKKQTRHYSALAALKEPRVIILMLVYFFSVTCTYGFNIWLPTVVKRASGLSDFMVGLLVAVPYLVGLLAMIAVGASSDRTRERRWHTAISLVVGGAGLILGALSKDITASMVFFCAAGAGLLSFLPSFWALPTSFLGGTPAAAAIGLINSVGNLGGFAGPYVVGYLERRTGSFIAGLTYLSVSAAVAAVLVLSLRHRSGDSKSG